MKKIITSILLVLLYSSTALATSSQQNYLGIVAQLIEVKYNSENYLASILNDTTKNDGDKSTALKNYNEVRVQTDRIIYQLAADMRAKNSIKKYKKLNAYYKEHSLAEGVSSKTCIKPYTNALEDMYNAYKKLVHIDTLVKDKLAGEIELALGIIELGWTINKELHEMRGQKVDGIIEIMDHLRLNPSSELNKKEEK